MALDNTFRLSNYSIPIHVDENKIFLIHGYTGAIDIVSKELFDDLLKNKFDELDNALIGYLEKRGILTRKNLEEERTHVARICELLKKRNLRFTPIIVTIPITYDCNFDCVYCFEKKRNNIKGKIISKKQVDNIFQCLSNLKKEGKKINMEFKRNNQLYKNIYNPTYKRFITASQILIDFLKYPFGDYFCYLF